MPELNCDFQPPRLIPQINSRFWQHAVRNIGDRHAINVQTDYNAVGAITRMYTLVRREGVLIHETSLVFYWEGQEPDYSHMRPDRVEHPHPGVTVLIFDQPHDDE